MRSIFPNTNTDPGRAQGRLLKEERIMRLTTKMTSTPLAMLSVLLMTVATAGFANAAAVDVYLQAQSFDKAVPDGSVPMWGFASCSNADFDDCAIPDDTDAPGPQIDAFAGFDLRIHVRNTLNIPVSIAIPGQTGEVDRVPVMMAAPSPPAMPYVTKRTVMARIANS